MKDFRRMLPGLLVSLVLIGAILYFVDLKAMVAAVKSANYVLLLVGSYIGGSQPKKQIVKNLNYLAQQ